MDDGRLKTTEITPPRAVFGKAAWRFFVRTAGRKEPSLSKKCFKNRKGVYTMDTFERVSDIIGKRFELSETKLTEETTWEEIGADSIDLVDLISELEDEFEISIPDEKIEDLKTVGDVAHLIDEEM